MYLWCGVYHILLIASFVNVDICIDYSDLSKFYPYAWIFIVSGNISSCNFLNYFSPWQFVALKQPLLYLFYYYLVLLKISLLTMILYGFIFLKIVLSEIVWKYGHPLMKQWYIWMSIFLWCSSIGDRIWTRIFFWYFGVVFVIYFPWGLMWRVHKVHVLS